MQKIFAYIIFFLYLCTQNVRTCALRAHTQTHNAHVHKHIYAHTYI